MFGQNPIRKVEHKPEDGKLAVQSIFYTIQGEGPYTGCPAVFIRLAGCHLACTFCDTDFESGMNNRVSAETLAGFAAQMVIDAALPPPMVVLTGGEPMRQNVVPLCYELVELGFRVVQIETAGNLWVEGLEALVCEGTVVLVCSPKTAHVHPMMATWCDHWKYVVSATNTDPLGLPYKATQANNSGPPWQREPGRGSNDVVWLSPMDEQDPVRNKANQQHAAKLCMQHGYRLSLQTHKILELP